MGKRRLISGSILALACGVVLLTAPGLIAKSKSSGGLDRSFGSGGLMSASIGSSGSVQVDDIAPAGRGSSVLSFLDTGSADGGVVKVGSQGGLDRKFGVGGIARLKFDSASLNPRDVLVGGNHHVFVTGESKLDGVDEYGGGLAVLGPKGRPDRSFAGDGISLPEPLSKFTPYEMSFSTGGRIVVVGIQGGIPSSSTTIARFLPGGRLDRSFSGDGVKVFKVHLNQLDRTVDVDDNGRIVVGSPGEVAPYSPSERRGDYDLVRLMPDGRFDPGFGGDGRITIDPTVYDDEITDLKVDGRGRILVAGGSNAYHGSVIRLRSSGKIDRDFGRNGVVEMPWFTPESVGIDQRGRIFPIGYTSSGNSDEMGAVQKVGPRGGLDGTFDGWNTGTRTLADGFVDGKGRILAAGNKGPRSAAVVRLRLTASPLR